MNKFKNLISTTLIFLSFSYVIAQKNQNQIGEKVEPIIQQIMKSYEVPGLAIGIVKDNEIVYAKGFGVKNIETNVYLVVESKQEMGTVPIFPPTMSIWRWRGRMKESQPLQV